ncbi:MAG: hypothetical protein HFG12_09725, partial [Oscillibacter sp.]|nr:hypothetical protein [Oscillibacter sp.]
VVLYPVCKVLFHGGQIVAVMPPLILPLAVFVIIISAAEVAEIEEWLANYPRRILGWKTPQMLYDEYMTVAA